MTVLSSDCQEHITETGCISRLLSACWSEGGWLVSGNWNGEHENGNSLW